MKSRLDRVIMSGAPTSIVVTLTLDEANAIRDALEMFMSHMGEATRRRAEPVMCRLGDELAARLLEAERPLQNAGRF